MNRSIMLWWCEDGEEPEKLLAEFSPLPYERIDALALEIAKLILQEEDTRKQK